MAAAGAASAAGRVSEESWRAFAERVVETLDVGPGTTVFDIQCGAGAFLFPLAENDYAVGGLDPSAALIKQAAAAMPSGRWSVGPAATMDPGEAWDVVVAVSAFASFKDLDEARGVLARMMAKAEHAIAILDVPEGRGGPDLQSIQYERAWMLHSLAEIGASAVQIEDQRLDGDPLAASRFNVFARV